MIICIIGIILYILLFYKYSNKIISNTKINNHSIFKINNFIIKRKSGYFINKELKISEKMVSK